MPELTTQQAFELARQHHRSGRLVEAEALYRQILAVEPRHADSLRWLGFIAAQAGRYAVAVELIGQAVALVPGIADFHCELGEAHRRLGHLDEAIAALRQALALKPGLADAHNNLGIALFEKRQLDEAIAAYRQAIALESSFPAACNNLGNALREKGQLDEAIAAFRRALALAPGYPEAHSNLGTALCDQGLLDAAIAAYRQAIALQSHYPRAYCNLGAALYEKGQMDEAIAACRQAIALQPDFPEAHSNLGTALSDTGRLDEAIAAFRQAMALQPDYSEAHSNLVLALNYHPGFDARAIAAEQRRWDQRHAEPLRPCLQPHPNDCMPGRRLRVGYVSPDFREHVVGANVLPLLERHDSHDFEVFCYAQVAWPDAFTGRFRAAAHHWRSTVGLTDEQLSAQIRRDEIDILVDLNLHCAHPRLLLFARKPAPVQVTFAGYPGSTGLKTIDYRLSDPYLDLPGRDESIYSERTVRLPHSFWCYDPHEGADISVNSLPAETHGFSTFGCLNTFCKINEPVLGLWAGVLRAVPGSRLLLLVAEGSHRQSTLDFLWREGVAPERIEFVARQPRRKYLEIYRRIDLGLDTLPYNGHTTSLDSLWMGVPVVTLVGQTIVGRAGFCQLMNLQLPELIARTPEEFVRIAADLARDLPRLTHLRSTLRERMEKSPLMDAPRFARDIESAYREMWRTWCLQNGGTMMKVVTDGG